MQCTICRLDEGEMNLVGGKRLKTLLMAASKKKETELTQMLKDHQNRGTSLHVHMIVGGGLPTFQRSLLDLNPKGQAHQLMLPSPGKLVVFYALSQLFQIKKNFTRSKHCHCTTTLLNVQKQGMMIGAKQYLPDWEHQMILFQKRQKSVS